MRPFIPFAIVIVMSTFAPAQTLPVPQAITDPKKITSKPSAQVEQNQQSLSIEKLYMTRQVGSSSWSPDGKSIVFVATSVAATIFGWCLRTGAGPRSSPSAIIGRQRLRGRPTASGSLSCPTMTAMSSGTYSSFRRRPGKL